MRALLVVASAALLACGGKSVAPGRETAKTAPPPTERCKAGLPAATGASARRFEQPAGAGDSEIDRAVIQPDTPLPREVILAGQTVRVLAVVHGCDARGRLRFLGLEIEVDGAARTIGFAPAPPRYDGQTTRADGCTLSPGAGCLTLCNGRPRGDVADCRRACQGVAGRTAPPTGPLCGDRLDAPLQTSQEDGVAVIDRLVVRGYLANPKTGAWANLTLARELHRERIRSEGGAVVNGGP